MSSPVSTPASDTARCPGSFFASPSGRNELACLLTLTAALASAISCRSETDANPDASTEIAAAAPDPKNNRPQFPAPTISLPEEPLTPKPEEMQQEAEQVAARIEADFPESPEALHVAAMLYYDLHQTEKAERIWKKCLQLAPGMVGVYVGLGGVAMGQGRDEEAVETLQKALAIGASSPDVYRNLAESLTKLGRTEEAGQTLTEAAQAFPQFAEIWLLLGQTQIRLDQFAQAEESLRKALDLGFHDSKVYYSLANACLRQGKKDQATEFRKRFAELKSDADDGEGKWSEVKYPAMLKRLDVAVLSNAGEIYLREGNQEEAERLLRRAVTLDPSHAKSHRLLAALYYAAGRYADAELVQQRLILLEPEVLLNYMNLANIGAALGDYQTAEAALQQVLAVSPDSVPACRGLAELYLHTGNLERARWFAEEAIRWDDSAPNHLLLALICERNGDAAAVKSALENAYRQSPHTLSLGSSPQGKPGSPALTTDKE